MRASRTVCSLCMFAMAAAVGRVRVLLCYGLRSHRETWRVNQLAREARKSFASIRFC